MMIQKQLKNRTWLVVATIFTLLFCNSVFSDVTIVSVVQDQENPIAAGSNISYTITVHNPATELAAEPNIGVFNTLSENITGAFINTSSNCTPDGLYYCDELLPGNTAVYRFEWASPPAVADYSLTFQVGCFIGIGTTTPCTGGSASLTTSVKTFTFSNFKDLSSNEQALANAFDAACTDLDAMDQQPTTKQQELLATCNLINTGTSEEKIKAIQELLPKQAPAQGGAAIEASTKQSNNVTARMSNLRSGIKGVSTLGLTLHYQGLILPGTIFNPLTALNATNEQGTSTPLYSRLGFFINGDISLGDKDASSDELAFDFTTKGLTAGADYRLDDQLIIGGAIGYVRNDTNFKDSRGSMSIDGHTLSLYSTYYHSEALYLDAIASVGWNSFNNSRKMSFESFSGKASGDTGGIKYSLSVGGGYDYYKNELSFGPYGRINYVNTDIDGYSESSAVGLALSFDDQNVTSLSTQIGGQLSYALSTSHGVFLPHLSFEWTHEFRNNSRNISASFVNDPTGTKFELSSDDPDRDYFNLTTGVTATLGNGKSAYIQYETLLGKDDLTQHTLSAGGRFEF